MKVLIPHRRPEGGGAVPLCCVSYGWELVSFRGIFFSFPGLRDGSRVFPRKENFAKTQDS
jgi:hypothetical protein